MIFVKYRNTIISLQTFKNLVNIPVYLKNNAKDSYSSLKICVPCGNLCLCFGLCNSVHCRFTQLYVGTPCCLGGKPSTFHFTYLFQPLPHIQSFLYHQINRSGNQKKSTHKAKDRMQKKHYRRGNNSLAFRCLGH